VLGQSLELDGRSYQIIGVMPPGFVYPGSGDLPYDVESATKSSNVWLPLALTAEQKTDRAVSYTHLLAKLYEVGPCSQNRLGRLTAMDAATIKGVIDRLTKRGFTEVRADLQDARLLICLLYTSRCV